MPRHQIDLLLHLFREALASNRVNYRRRNKERETLSALGITPSEAYRLIANLTAGDALKPMRPNDDARFPEESVCEFGMVYKGHDIYVKISACGCDDGVTAFVLSFHFAERTLDYLCK